MSEPRVGVPAIGRCSPGRGVFLFVLVLLSLAPRVRAQDPQALIDLRAREGKDLTPQAIRSKDGVFTGRVLGKVPNEIVRDSGVYALDIDIGSETHASCEVVVEGFDLASALLAAAGRTINEFALQYGTLTQRILERTEAGAFGSNAYLALDWLMVIENDGQSRVGVLKQIGVSIGTRALYCAHLEPGFSKSFRAAAQTLAESIRFRDAGTVPFFTEVRVARQAGATAGVQTLTMERTADGTTLLQTRSSFILRTTAATSVAYESHYREQIRASGALAQAVQLTSINGALVTEVTLSPLKADRWQVRGEVEGRAVDEVLAAPVRPSTTIQEARARRALFAQKPGTGTPLTATRWTGAAPTRLITTRTTAISVVDATRIVAREEMDGRATDVVLDRATGLPAQSSITIGALAVELERVHVRGAF